jgi:hypothetical protein
VAVGSGAGPVIILDPTAERDPGGRPLAAPRPSGDPLRLVLLDINKPRGSVFLDELERLLTVGGHIVERTTKPTFTKPAPIDLRQKIAERCDAVVEALAD